MKQKNKYDVRWLLLIGFILFTGCVADKYESQTKYNLTGMGNSTDITDLFVKVNDELMFGTFGVLILVAIFILTYMSYFAATQSGVRALASSSFIGFIVSILLLSLGILPVIYVLAMMVGAGVFTALIKD